MKKLLLLAISGLFLIGCASTKKASDVASAHNTKINTSINIATVIDDKVPVTINPGVFTAESVTYRMPKIIPGTYSIADYGSFIDDFKAIDYSGNELSVTRVDINTWTVSNAKELDKITYNVNDTFDIEGGELATPFSPAGTNIDSDNFVLNLFGFIGYFDSLKSNQYSIVVTSPSDFKKTSALQSVSVIENEDSTTTTTYFAPRYFDVMDNPMIYGNLDIETFMVGDIEIVLSVYSPNKIHTAKQIKETVLSMMQAQKTYLGEINTTPRYDIYIYLSTFDEVSPKGFGALEHHTSTVAIMPEMMPAQALAKSVIGIVSHEFFHIVTPLSLHSEDVHYFDYADPTFSKHLWMYEGVTEYFSTIFQIDQNLISEEEFYKKITGKIQNASGYDDTMSFTAMSENVLDEPYSTSYLNVYQKGALIGMCIDILIREGSNGEQGILSLMKELSLKYGKNNPFEDDKIIDEIVTMTYPSVRSFFDTHVIGTTPINYTDFFNKVGLEFTESKVETNFVQNNGAFIFAENQENGMYYFNNSVVKNSFWNELGIQPNDVVKSVDGLELTKTNVQQVLGSLFRWQPGSEFEKTIIRDGCHSHTGVCI